MDLPFDLSTGQGAFLAAALFAAAVIRGFSGFGFSAIFIILAALTTNPLPLIPVVFSCEIAMTVFQARDIRPHIDWNRAIALLAGAAIATVPAIAIMARLGEQEARLAISSLILVLSLVLLSGWQLERPVGRNGNVGVGAIAGIANSAGVGGLPVAAFLTAQPVPPAVFRATMIVFLTGIDLMALPVMAANGLVGPETLTGILLAFPILGLGIWAGSHSFKAVSQRLFRRAVVLMLTALSLINIARLAF
ncbi:MULTISPECIES: sulfite exporter TauE/SafE family protein [unclassified Leisingera]|uniref:sulfite exporter TauE/SafE family protein n=1 Tax=unclassified Leisingera TaxID=2614906 RepID=UPI00030D073E|nr:MULTISPECIES: sulfite exporter TauE/SafE family protein [unclassified Leisingera]KIC24726.1 sulfite exporter tauE/safE-like protein [Leisingera sp. ANG-S3]KIC55419.1 sulfite exporter tauE/safE-like protein [Leisingera sp. ANG-S]KID09150.1 sulfite exporter tauE/safE-like protein [Leisingera sp. ANG1]